MLTPKDVYPSKLSEALNHCGEYVYAYYEDGNNQPFYVGKGIRDRVMQHWKKALESPQKQHEIKIKQILDSGSYPQIKLLAYNLDSTDEKVYSIAERVLQDAFGIQSVWKKTGGSERLEDISAVLLQKREESANTPCLSIDAAIAKADICGVLNREGLQSIADNHKTPILLVGLSKTYHPKYNESQLSQMARMYWNLNKYKNTSLNKLLAGDAFLVAWSSKINERPMIIGAWKIAGNEGIYYSESERYEFPAFNDMNARKLFIGQRLEGTGNNWQGQKIYIPS